MRGLAALAPPAPGMLAMLAAAGTGSSRATGDRTRLARRARHAGVTAAAAGVVAASALAGARLGDAPAPAAGAPVVGGGAPAATRPPGGRSGPIASGTGQAA